MTVTSITKSGTLSYSGSEPFTNPARGDGPYYASALRFFPMTSSAKFITVATSDGGSYSFGYEFTDTDYMVRRNNATATWTFVANMGGGGLAGEADAFDGSTTDLLAWGSDFLIEWAYLLGSDSSYAAKVAGITGDKKMLSHPPVITPGQMYTGKVGVAFGANIEITGRWSNPAVSWLAGGLPPGLSLVTFADLGTISGTPTSAGVRYPYVVATNGEGSCTEAVGITIDYGEPIIPAGQTLAGKFGTAFSATPALTNAVNCPASAWEASGLPAWASINAATGAITGTPNARGDTTVAITATGDGGTDTENVTISIGYGVPIIQAGQTFAGKYGEAFTATAALTDGADRPAASWATVSKPSWASINATTGAITGTPNARGNKTAQVKVTGAGGNSVVGVVISIGYGVPIIPGGQTFTGKIGSAFSATPALTASADRPASSWSATGLPTWASINAGTGAITGTPDARGDTTVSITATGAGGTDTEDVTISIGYGLPVITGGQTFTGKCGEAFSESVSLTDATNRPATSWSATGLPGGLSINATTGAVTGTPTVSGAFTPSIRATGSAGYADETVSITLAVGAPLLADGRIMVGLTTVPFSGSPQLVNAAHRPVTLWAATGLPAWASISTSTGVISGTPDTPGETVISVTGTGSGGTDTEDVTISIGSSADVVGSVDVITGDGLSFWSAMASARAGTAVQLPGWVEQKLSVVFVRGLGNARAVAMMVDESTIPSTMRLVTNADIGPAEYASMSWSVKK